MNDQLKNCTITFSDRATSVFSAGETVTGSLNLTLNKTKKFNALVLRVKGYTHIRWTKGSKKHKRVYSANETYFKTYIHLIVPQASESAHEFASGLHKFNFSFVLPISIPSSFSGGYGRTCYELKATVKQPDKTFNQCYKTPFTVFSTLNLNQIQGVEVPYSVAKSNKFYFILSKIGTCYITIEIPRRAFVCGEKIPITCTINNQSEVKIEKLKINMIQMITYIARGKQRMAGSGILSTVTEGVDKMTETIKDIYIQVPTMPSTSTNDGLLLKINYSIAIKVKMNGMHEDMNFEFPIIIGTIPLMSNQPIAAIVTPPYNPSYQPQYMEPTTSMQKSTEERTGLPPTYEEATSSGSQAMNGNGEYGEYNPRHDNEKKS